MMRCYAGIEAQLAWGLLFSGDEGVLGAPVAQDYAGIVEGLEAAELLKLITLARRRLEDLGEVPGDATDAENGWSRTVNADQGLSASVDQGHLVSANQGQHIRANHGQPASAEQGRSASAAQGQLASENQGQPVEANHGRSASADNGQVRATRAGTVPSGAAPATELFIDKQYRIRLSSPQGTEIPFRPLVRALFVLFLKHPEGILLKDRGRFQEELAEIYAVVAPNVSSEDRRRRVSRLTDLRENAFSENLSVLNATLDRILPAPQAGDCKVQGYNGHPRRIPLSPLLVHWAG